MEKKSSHCSLPLPLWPSGGLYSLSRPELFFSFSRAGPLPAAQPRAGPASLHSSLLGPACSRFFLPRSAALPSPFSSRPRCFSLLWLLAERPKTWPSFPRRVSPPSLLRRRVGLPCQLHPLHKLVICLDSIIAAWSPCCLRVVFLEPSQPLDPRLSACCQVGPRCWHCRRRHGLDRRLP